MANNDFKGRNIPNIVIRDAEILGGGFKNFSGRVSQYNDKGIKKFNVVIPDSDTAQQLSEDGWNVKILRPKNEEEEPKHYIEVAINFNFWRKPIVNMRCNDVITELDDESIGVLDNARITHADVNIRARAWEPGRIKAYLDELMVEIEPPRKSMFLDDYDDEERAPWEN